MKAPVYVKVEKYKEVESTISQIKAKIEEAKGILNKRQEIKADEEHELQSWHDEVKQVEEKITAVENSMEK